MDRKRTLLWSVMAVAAAGALAQLGASRPRASAPVAAQPRPAAANAAAVRFAALPARQAIGEPKGQLFGPRSWAPPAASPPKAAAAEQPAPPPRRSTTATAWTRSSRTA